jgi:two-component system LytT family sensor kinase
MTPHNIAALVNLLGFITGGALYAMLLALVLRAARPVTNPTHEKRVTLWTEPLLLATALLGLSWNLGALIIYGARDWGAGRTSAWLEAAVFTALGFLPAVVVHSVLRAGEGLIRRNGAGGESGRVGEWESWRNLSHLPLSPALPLPSNGGEVWTRLITVVAYALSAFAGLLHFHSAHTGGDTPSATALRALTFGFSGLTLVLIIFVRRSSIWKRALWVVALSVFAVSALHLSQHTGGEDSWFIELIGHHASLPLVIAMLYQDYRFALADIFLKRALALVVLVVLAFGLYLIVAAPLLRAANGDPEPATVGALIALWISTALVYPPLRRAIAWFVDAVVLRRANYQELRDELARVAASSEDPQEILDTVCAHLSRALTASEVCWLKQGDLDGAGEQGGEVEFVLPSEVVRVVDAENGARARPQQKTLPLRRAAATVLIPTHEPPRYSLVIGELSGGRRLLSDDIALLESVALMLARRIDAVRVMHERCQRNLREQEIGKLATEAELRALRAQLNPHFLFNALTTIGYLIQTAPERALDTLMRLTGLLRAVLRAPNGEFVTVGEEMDLIESYLAIERARFEERLRVVIDMPVELYQLRIPPLVLQPLVENAIKHGISPCKEGGEVVVSARIENGDGVNNLADSLCISVRDTGVGASEVTLARGRRQGVGLSNVRRRLACVYGQAASLNLTSNPGRGTVAEIRMPLAAQTESQGTQARAAVS